MNRQPRIELLKIGLIRTRGECDKINAFLTEHSAAKAKADDERAAPFQEIATRKCGASQRAGHLFTSGIIREAR